jgi:hypothetical protein
MLAYYIAKFLGESVGQGVRLVGGSQAALFHVLLSFKAYTLLLVEIVLTTGESETQFIVPGR